MTDRTIKIKTLINGEVCMGTYGLVELELLDIEKETEELRKRASMTAGEQLVALTEFAKKNYTGLPLFSLEEIMSEYLKTFL